MASMLPPVSWSVGRCRPGRADRRGDPGGPGCLGRHPILQGTENEQWGSRACPVFPHPSVCDKRRLEWLPGYLCFNQRQVDEQDLTTCIVAHLAF